jgi:hypothetical protein
VHRVVAEDDDSLSPFRRLWIHRKEELSLFLNASETGSPTVWTPSLEPIIGRVVEPQSQVRSSSRPLENLAPGVL